MNLKYATALLATPLIVTLTTTAQQPQPPAGDGAARGQSAPAGERGRGRGAADPFAGQPRINALGLAAATTMPFRGGC